MHEQNSQNWREIRSAQSGAISECFNNQTFNLSYVMHSNSVHGCNQAVLQMFGISPLQPDMLSWQ